MNQQQSGCGPFRFRTSSAGGKRQRWPRARIFSTNTHGGGSVVLPSSDSCMGGVGKHHRELSEGALFQGAGLVRMPGVQGSSPALPGRQEIFLFNFRGAGEICASCLTGKAVPGRRNRQ